MEAECLEPEVHNIEKVKNEATEIDDVDIVSEPADILISSHETVQENSCVLNEDYISCDKIVESKTSKCRPLLMSLQPTKDCSETNVDQSMESTAQKINLVYQDKEISGNNNESDEILDVKCLEKVEFDSLDEGIPDENDVYNRFYFESNHLALKDNPE